MKWQLFFILALLGLSFSSSYATTIDCGASANILVASSGVSTITIGSSTFSLGGNEVFTLPCTSTVSVVASGSVVYDVYPSWTGVDPNGYTLHDILIAGFCITAIGLGFLVGGRYA